MSRRVRLLLFAAGAAVFAYLVSRIGLGVLVADARQTGWMFIPILLLYGIAVSCNVASWAIIIAGEPRRPSFRRLYLVTVAGFALNFVTPMVNVGGEPFRIAAVAPWLTTRRAAGSVIIHNVTRGLSFLLSWLTALGLGFVMLPHTPWIIAALVGATLVIAVLTGVVFSGHRRGALEKMLNLLHRLPLLNRLGRTLEPRRELLAQMDGQIAEFYHQHPRRFAGALALEYLGRAIYMGEYYLIGLSVGIRLDYVRAYVIGSLSSLIQTLFFFVPFEVGSKEGSLYLLFQMLGLDPHLGVYTAIVSRLRDLIWIGVGLLLVWSAGHRAVPPSPSPETPA